MSDVVIETIHESAVLMEALQDLVNKGFAELSEVKASDANAAEQAARWDIKIDVAKELIKKLNA